MLPLYGFGLTGVDVAPWATVPPDWDVWSFAQVSGPPEAIEATDIDAERATIRAGAVGRFELDRTARTVRLATPSPLSPAAVLHPGIVPAAVAVSHWSGRACLHGAAIAVDGAAWILLGDRGAGKSTTAAVAVDAGHGLLADDLVVLDGGAVLAGPPTIDLREDAAAHFGGVALGVVGARARWRRSHAPAHQRLPLAGFVWLRWADRLSLREAGAPERLAWLTAQAILPLTPDTALTLAARPMFELRRPAGAGTVDAAVEVLLRRVAS